jgi:hypothetical protein
MKMKEGPMPPVERLATSILFQATSGATREVMLTLDGDQMKIAYDGRNDPPTQGNLFPEMLRVMFRFAGKRLWPWSKTCDNKRLELEFEASGATSVWSMNSTDLQRELRLKRMT